MEKRLEVIEARYKEIQDLLQKPEIASNVSKMTSLLKEMKSLEKTVQTFAEYKEVKSEIEDLKEMVKDDDVEIKQMAELELSSNKQREEELVDKLRRLLLPKDENDEKNVICEIRGAAGGEEGNIFAADLFRMYSRFAEVKKWKLEVLDSNPTGHGGFSLIEFSITGENVYSFLKYESGAHRVQRIPITESNGRIQTSTATVLVMPEAEELDVTLNLEDVRIDTFCASGPGGQCVNTTKSAIRVTHIPTGLVVQCQDGKNQHENKANALKVLKTRLYDKLMEDKAKEEGKERLAKIGHGDRSEKIRTYNYPQNRVTDHRIGFTINQLDKVMEGKLDPIIEALIAEEERRLLAGEKE